MDPDFYRALEDRFRGSRDLIKSRLQVYLPFIEPLKEAYPDLHAIDLGCGRGEWLEILRELEFQAKGVDLNDGMLSACRDLGLKVQTGDALSILRKLPDESQVIVSAFHLVEHIPFEDLQEIVKESLRVLKPAGLLILETPNPENIIVGTSSFYMDPTHTSPIPPDLLAFLPEYYGYHNTKILRLQETPQIRNLENLNLFDVFNGSSPDYAVVAQKCGTKNQLELTKHAFQADYGTTQEQLSMAYDINLKELFQQTQKQHELFQQTQKELQAIYKSRSWRITKPSRFFMGRIRKIIDIAKNRLIDNINNTNLTNVNSSFREFFIRLIKILRIYTPIRKFYYWYRRRAHSDSKPSPIVGDLVSLNPKELPPKTRQVYEILTDKKKR